MRRVVLESPYKGNVPLNEAYARACLADCLARGEAPFASHLLYTQPGVLRDGVPEEQKKGMEAGWAWRSVADAVVVYADLGITEGMQQAIEDAGLEGVPVEKRFLFRISAKNEEVIVHV